MIWQRDESGRRDLFRIVEGGGVILSAVRRWGGGQQARLSGRWKLGFWGDLVEANQQHPKYTARALRLCSLVSLVQTAVQGNDLQRKSSVHLYRPSMVLVDWGNLIAPCYKKGGLQALAWRLYSFHPHQRHQKLGPNISRSLSIWVMLWPQICWTMFLAPQWFQL